MSADETEPVPKTEQSPILPDPAPEPEPHEKKRRKAAAEQRPPERAAFLDGFPKDPELESLVEAFVNGNYARVRSDAPQLAEQHPDPAVRDAARELFQRIQPDPLARYILFASMGLLILLSVIALVSHGGHAP